MRDVDFDASELRARVAALEETVTILVARLDLLGRRVAASESPARRTAEGAQPVVRMRRTSTAEHTLVESEVPPEAREHERLAEPGRYSRIAGRTAPRTR